MVSSGAHAWAGEKGIQFDNLSGEKVYDPRQFYGQSKLANGLFSRELARRIADTDATSNSLHPGVIKTNLIRHMPGRADDDGSWADKDIPQGAATQCYVATAPALAGVSGLYFKDCNPTDPHEQMTDDAVGRETVDGLRGADGGLPRLIGGFSWAGVSASRDGIGRSVMQPDAGRRRPRV